MTAMMSSLHAVTSLKLMLILFSQKHNVSCICQACDFYHVSIRFLAAKELTR